MKRALVVLALLALGCARKTDYLEPKPPGPPRFHKTYQFTLNTNEKATIDVDILWVIDNSSSMGPYQQRVIKNSAAFISQFTKSTKLHWRMGLLSTTLGQAPFMGFSSLVDWTTPDSVSQFNTAVAQLGIGGDTSHEQTFGPVLDSVHNHPS